MAQHRDTNTQRHIVVTGGNYMFVKDGTTDPHFDRKTERQRDIEIER